MLVVVATRGAANSPAYRTTSNLRRLLRKAVVGEPGGRVPEPGRGTAQSPRSAAPWKNWYCARSTCVVPATIEPRAPSSTGGGRDKGVWQAFVLGLNLGSLGLESAFMSFLWQEILVFFFFFQAFPGSTG